MHRTLFDPLKESYPWAWMLLNIGILLVFGYLLSALVKRAMLALQSYALRVMSRQGEVIDREAEKRTNTVVSVLRRPIMILIWATVLFGVLGELGVRIEPLLAGAGVGAGIIGVAVGFGAQTLIKDMIAGMFLLMENQIRLGDVAVINGTGGLVEEINLRTTVLRGENGAVHIFPNGSIQTLANLTREFAYSVLELSLGFDQDPDRAIALLTGIAEEMRADPTLGPLILGPLDVMGVDRFLNTGMIVKVRIKTIAQRQWMIGREFNRRILSRFQAEGIGLAAAPNVVRLEGGAAEAGGRDVLKTAIREVLSEMNGPGASK